MSHLLCQQPTLAGAVGEAYNHFVERFGVAPADVAPLVERRYRYHRQSNGHHSWQAAAGPIPSAAQGRLL